MEGDKDLARFPVLIELEDTTIALHLHALFSGLLPPFLDFFNAMLSHYQVHVLHLDPKSIILFSAFVFLCEAFVGIAPSVALLRHLFSLQLIVDTPCSGCCSAPRARRWARVST